MSWEAAEDSPGTYLIVVPWELEAPGGVSQVVLNLERELGRSKRVRPAVLISSWEHRRPTLASEAGRRVVRYRLRPPARPLAHARAFCAWLLTLPTGLLKLRGLLIEQRVAVVNCHYPTLSVLPFALLRASRLARTRLVLSFHGWDVEVAAAASGFEQRLWRFIVSQADAVTACSRSLAGRVHEVFARQPGSVEVVHNGVDPEAIEGELSDGPKHALTPAPSRPFLLCVSGFVAKKALEVLVEAVGRAGRDLAELDVIIAGKNGPEYESIRRQVSARQLDERITLLTDLPHPAVTWLMRRATLFVLPSRDEPFGIVILEAGLAGLPVVATRVGGIPEIIPSAEYGELVPPDDPDALARALVELVRDRCRAKTIGESLRARVLRGFSWRTASRHYLRIADAA